MTSTQLLCHYDPGKRLIMLCDASSYGVAAVLSYRMPNGDDKPIAFPSKTLTPAERSYPHLKKEALAIIFGVKKIHEYCFGRFFTIKTDHKPLLGLIGERKGIPVNSAARIQKWSLFLSNYQYKLVYRSSNENANADALRRLPLPGTNKTKEDKNCFRINLSKLDNSPVHSKEVEIESRRDNIIARVLESVLTGNWGLCENTFRTLIVERISLG